MYAPIAVVPEQPPSCMTMNGVPKSELGRDPFNVFDGSRVRCLLVLSVHEKNVTVAGKKRRKIYKSSVFRSSNLIFDIAKSAAEHKRRLACHVEC